MKNFLLILFSCLGFMASAQNPQQVIDYADRLYERGEYLGAVQFYKAAMEIDSANTYLLYQYGTTFRHLNKLEKAAHYLEKVSKLDWENQYPYVDFELAEVYFQLGEHRYADRYYRRALRSYRRDKDSEWYKRINQRMEAIDYAKAQAAESENKKVKKLQGINTIDSEFSPTLLNDSTLLFASLRADSLGTNERINDLDYYSRIYKSNIGSDSVWNQAELLSDNVNLSNWDIANPAFDTDNNLLYFSKCDSSANCEIWRSKYLNGEFQPAERLESSINQEGSNNTQAFPINIKGTDYLFFVSDREGGFGQLDIWYSTKDGSGTYTEAQNAGAEINSIDNEITPFYSYRENRLYFSSTWHFGNGGYDVLYSKGTPGNFSKPQNLGSGVNSPYNDFYFSLGSNDLYFVSDRPEKNNNCCCNNIYTASYESKMIPDIEEMEKKQKTVVVRNNEAKTPVIVSVDLLNQYLPVELYFHNDYPNPNSWDTTTTSNYADLAENYIKLQDEYVQAYSENYPESEKEAARNEIKKFFDKEVIDGFEKLEFFMPMLVQELKKGNSIKMTIKGYASSISGSDYNLNLTLRRIESLINYLKNYDGGTLKPYMQGTAVNGGSLNFVKLPFGDYVNPGNAELSGNMKIYSPQAAKNRKIEILAITESEEGSKSLDGSNVEEVPKITFNSTSYQLKVKTGDKVPPTFLVKNSGKAPLKIYAVDVNCECADVEFTENIEEGKEGKISVNINTKGLSGKKKIQLLVISNSVPNIQKLTIDLLIEP